MRTPRILLVYKRSPLISAGRLSGAHVNTARFQANHREHYQTLRQVEAQLSGLGLPYHKHMRNPKIDYSCYDIVITVGGDGTVLDSARWMNEKQLLLGVNSDPSWSVGQFCRANRSNFQKVLGRILNGEARTVNVHKLEVRLTNLGKTLYCLNDVLICHRNPAAMSRYEIRIGRITEEHRDSGIWFASAAGSTGAILSAGGVKLPEKSRSIQYQPRELYHVKSYRYKLSGGVIGPRVKAEVVSYMPFGRIFADGYHRSCPFSYGHKAVIFSSERHIRLVHG